MLTVVQGTWRLLHRAVSHALKKQKPWGRIFQERTEAVLFDSRYVGLLLLTSSEAEAEKCWAILYAH